MEHSKTPWKIGAMESGQAAIDSADGKEVTGFIDMEDARRILACVNACAGIPTDYLELPDDNAMQIAKRGYAEIIALRQQRDELLAVLEAMLEEVAGCYCTTEAEARAVIKKVRSGE